jgi:pimeloyl-ACP methyl ester carboxylesterase
VAERLESLTASDGRRLDLVVAGPESGEVVIAHTGTPSGGRLFAPLVDEGAERGLSHISYARPGYADSDRDEGRSVADCVADTAAIADRLGIDRFHTLGWSGGGPHALACAALLPDRVVSAASIAGVAPREADGLDWYAGMGEENIEEMGLAEMGGDELRPWLDQEVKRLADVGAEDLHAALGGLISDVDREALTGDYARFLESSLRAAVKRGSWGWLDDDLAFVRDWGFDLEAIRVPVTIWHGAQDQFVPIAHGRWLADHVPGARSRLLDDHGHMSLSIAHYGAILDGLLSAGSTDE